MQPQKADMQHADMQLVEKARGCFSLKSTETRSVRVGILGLFDPEKRARWCTQHHFAGL